jgi:hypothetical protein
VGTYQLFDAGSKVHDPGRHVAVLRNLRILIINNHGTKPRQHTVSSKQCFRSVRINLARSNEDFFKHQLLSSFYQRVSTVKNLLPSSRKFYLAIKNTKNIEI